jgi:hypothetical protein
MINNTSNIERIEFFSKHTTNFPQTTPPKTTTSNPCLSQ